MRTPYKKMMDYCTYCPKMCHFSCPVSEATKNETHTAWGKMELARWFTEKTIPLSSENVLPIYQCSNCLHCQKYCEHNNDVPEALRQIRQLAVANYVAPEAAYQVEKNFAKANNPYGVDLYSQVGINDYPLKFFKNHVEVLFLPSCHTLHHFPERIHTYYELFKKLKIEDITLLKDSIQCCGEPLRALGFQKGYEEIAEVQSYSAKPYKVVISDGAECCYSIKSHYAQDGMPVKARIYHLLEFLAPFLEHSNYQTEARIRERLAFYDSPHLARHLKLSELPRKILTLVTGFGPLSLNMQAEDSLSTGAEGSYHVLFPQTAEKMAQRVLKEAKSRGIKKLITACPKSEDQFKRLKPDFEVQDIYEYLNDYIHV